MFLELSVDLPGVLRYFLCYQAYSHNPQPEPYVEDRQAFISIFVVLAKRSNGAFHCTELVCSSQTTQAPTDRRLPCHHDGIADRVHDTLLAIVVIFVGELR